MIPGGVIAGVPLARPKSLLSSSSEQTDGHDMAPNGFAGPAFFATSEPLQVFLNSAHFPLNSPELKNRADGDGNLIVDKRTWEGIHRSFQLSFKFFPRNRSTASAT